jgi:hypothetical protein
VPRLRLLPDLTPLRRSRDLRLAVSGGLISNLGKQAAVAGGADSVSAVCRSTINQTVTPEAMRGRMSAVFGLVVSGGPRLGDIESGTVAGVTGRAVAVT